VQRVEAHPGKNQRVLALQESLGTHAAGSATLGGVHFQRSDLRRAVFGAGQCIGIAGHGEHHCTGSGSQAVLALFIGPCHLAGGNHVEGRHTGALGQLDAGHTARSTTLRAHVLRLKGQ